MVHPGYAPVPPQRSAADLVVSIAALVLTVLLGAGGVVMGVFSLAFLDYCPPETCSADGAVDAVVTALLIAAAIGVVGFVLTVVALVRRATAWPFAVTTFALCALALAAGGVGYASAVG